MKRLVLVGLSLLLALAWTMPAAAEDISGQLEKGLKLYQEGKLSPAIGEIELALARLKQKKAEVLAQALPEPLPGWTVAKASGAGANGGMLGGGISASRQYQEKGQGRVKVEVVTDSPLLQSLAMMLSNPMFLQSGKGGKLVSLQGHKAILHDHGDQAEMQALIDNKALLRVNAWRVKHAAKVVESFAGKVDLAKLKELIQ